MMDVATQALRKNFDKTCPPVRVKHFISCSYRDLDFLATHLEGITTETYTEELMNKTTDKGDCCMLSTLEWGHARLEYEDDLARFEDEDHMNYVGEFYLRLMKLAYMVITISSWLHQMIVMLTILFLFI